MIKEDETIWENELLNCLAQNQQLTYFKHKGFWQPMETLRDKKNLEKLWRQNNPLLRNYFSYLAQKPYLIDGTIIENIAFSQNIQDADFERIKESSKKAKIYSFIDALSKKFHTNIGKVVTNLSEVLQQRIQSARLFYLKKKILIMDSVKSNLNERTGKEKISSLNNLQPEINLINITHKY